jgi:hypothetical protein
LRSSLQSRIAHPAFVDKIKFNPRQQKTRFAASMHRIQARTSGLSPLRDARHSFIERN